MTLSENYEAIAPSVVAFISRFRRGRLNREQLAQLPPMPAILGTGFFVDSDGIVVTNRHVTNRFAQIPAHPKTGQAGYGALLFDNTVDEKGQFVIGRIADVMGYSTFDSFSSTGSWHGETIPDIAFVQLKLKETPFLKLAHHDFYVRPGTAVATVGFPMGDVGPDNHGQGESDGSIHTTRHREQRVPLPRASSARIHNRYHAARRFKRVANRLRA